VQQGLTTIPSGANMLAFPSAQRRTVRPQN
jgi:hypothetical protein